MVLIVRGGSLAAIDGKLRGLGLPPVEGAGGDLPSTPVAFVWVPQTAGAPDVPGNAPRAYWPGSEYVDWVGTDFYSRFPNFRGLDRFYAEFSGKPFVFGEWAMWGRDDAAFVDRFMGWVASHPRVKMLVYNQGSRSEGPFRIWRYPRSASRIRQWTSGPRHLAYTPEYGG